MINLQQHGNFEELRSNLRAFEREQQLSSCLQALENAFRAVPFLAPPTVLTGAQHAELYYSLQRSCAKAVDLIGWSNGVLRTEGGFAGAFGLVRVWAKPFEQRRQYVNDIWMWLECAGSFRDEVANMHGAAQVAEAYRLPNGCTVIPFSGQTQKPEVAYAEL